MPALGAHMSVAGGVSTGLERARKIKIDAVQIFTKNNNRWFEKPLKPEEVERFRTGLKDFERRNVFSHTCYLINLASPDRSTQTKSLKALQDELERADTLGLPWIVLHPGSHVGKGEDWGTGRIIDGLDTVLEKTSGLKAGVLLETTAGQGSSIGHTFQQLARIRKGVSKRKRIGVCVDTCHIFAAGYEIRDLKSYLATMAELDRHVGIRHVHAVHLNDSKKPLGSRVDRHEHIGDGEIGLDGFAHILNDPRFADVPMVLETPKGPEMKEDVRNLKRLKKLLGKVKVKP